MTVSQGFIAQELALEFYNGKALLNVAMTVLYDDTAETAFTFPGYVSSYLRVYDERLGQLLKNFTTQITVNSNVMVFNMSVADMTFQDVGTYYFELGYNQSGYEVPIRYGKFEIK